MLRRGAAILGDNRDKLDAIVKQLLIHETLDEPDVYAAAGIRRPAGGGGNADAQIAARVRSRQ